MIILELVLIDFLKKGARTREEIGIKGGAEGPRRVLFLDLTSRSLGNRLFITISS